MKMMKVSTRLVWWQGRDSRSC